MAADSPTAGHLGVRIPGKMGKTQLFMTSLLYLLFNVFIAVPVLYGDPVNYGFLLRPD
jgi:hypothetical protein